MTFNIIAYLITHIFFYMRGLDTSTYERMVHTNYPMRHLVIHLSAAIYALVVVAIINLVWMML